MLKIPSNTPFPDISEALLEIDGDDAIKAFAAGTIDAVLMWEPFVSEAKAAGGVQIFSAADFPGLTYSVFTVRRDFIQAHPREVEALARVWKRTESYIREHPSEACARVAAWCRGESIGRSPSPWARCIR